MIISTLLIKLLSADEDDAVAEFDEFIVEILSFPESRAFFNTLAEVNRKRRNVFVVSG